MNNNDVILVFTVTDMLTMKSVEIKLQTNKYNVTIRKTPYLLTGRVLSEYTKKTGISTNNGRPSVNFEGEIIKLSKE